MCGRFTQALSWAELHNLYNVSPGEAAAPPTRWNGAPSQQFLICRARNDSSHTLTTAKWGLTPEWANRPLINARAETIATKPSFRSLFASRRCLVPATGWFEWRTGKTGQRQPWWISLPDRRPFSFAGIFSGHGDELEFAIVTCGAADSIIGIHARQPVIIPPHMYGDWLRPSPDKSCLQKLIAEPRFTEYEFHRVNLTVNNPRHDSPDLIEPMTD